MQTVIESIATANPEFCVSQQDAAANMQRVEELSSALRKRIPQIYRLSGIDRRFSCVAEYARDPSLPEFDPKGWEVSYLSSTRRRNEHYKASVVPIAERAAREAIGAAELSAADITHLVVVSCTGFFAPGLDILLVKSLGMRADTQRTLIGFMGCYAAFNALRVADAFCKADPDAKVLIVCAELCSLHFQIENTIESAVVNSLFADGAAAAVLRLRDNSDPAAAGKLAYMKNLAVMDDDSLDHMSWEIGDSGFLMGLSPRVPDVLAKQLPGYVARLLREANLSREAIHFWAIHPGGRQIVEKAQESLGLTDGDVHDSLEILRQYGNMSAPTVLFVLKRITDAAESDRKDGFGVAMAFGPGLTIEGCLLERVKPPTQRKRER